MTERVVWNCRQLVTLAGPPGPRTGSQMGEIGIIPDGAMLLRGEKIHAIGTLHDIEALCSAATDAVDAGGRIVLPGFVDAHTHPVFAGNRADELEQRAQGATYAQIAAAGGGILSTVRRTRAACPPDLLAAARRYREWFLRGGTTTIEAKSGYGLSLDSELKILGVIRELRGDAVARYVPTFLGAHEIAPEHRGDPARYAGVVIHEMLPRVRQQRLAEFCDVFCEPSVFPVSVARQILEAARDLGFGLRIHADQFGCDGGAQLAAELGASTADHLEHTGAEGLEALRASAVQPVLLPASVYNLDGRYPAARRMIDAGLAVVLATDFNPGSSPTASMPMVLSLAATHLHMSAAEAITAATMNAACSLGREEQIGSLEPGKFADFAIHDCEDYRELPYFFGRDTARAVYVGGSRVYP